MGAGSERAPRLLDLQHVTVVVITIRCAMTTDARLTRMPVSKVHYVTGNGYAGPRENHINGSNSEANERVKAYQAHLAPSRSLGMLP